MVFVLDTNIVIHYLRMTQNVRRNFNDSITRNDIIVIPRVVDYEIRRGFRILHAPKKEAMYNVLVEHTGYSNVAELDLRHGNIPSKSMLDCTEKD